MGNIDAFEKVYKAYFNGLERFAQAYVKDRDDANDIVQSVFLTLWEKRETLAPNTNLTNFLITLTKNQCLNFLNHLKARTNYLFSQERSWKEIQLNYYALERFNANKLIFTELEGSIQKAIDSLPGQASEIFKMSRFEGFKYAEIADKLGISIKTVEKKMSIALEFLREALKGYYLLVLFLIFIFI